MLTPSAGISILLFSRRAFAFLEHLEHSVSDHEAAENVRRAEDHGDEPQRVKQRACRGSGDEKRSSTTMPWIALVPTERRVQHRGNAADHLEPTKIAMMKT